MVFPILKKLNESPALGYLAFRHIEAVIIIVAVISPLTLIPLSQKFSSAGTVDASYYQAIGDSLLAVRTILAG